MPLVVELPYERELVVQSQSTFEFLLRWSPGKLPIDWDGWDAWMAIGKSYDEPLLELTVGNGLDLQPDGKLYITMSADQTAHIATLDFPKRSGTGTLRYNLTLVDPLGKPHIFMRGKLFLELNVPRPK